MTSVTSFSGGLCLPNGTAERLGRLCSLAWRGDRNVLFGLEASISRVSAAGRPIICGEQSPSNSDRPLALTRGSQAGQGGDEEILARTKQRRRHAGRSAAAAARARGAAQAANPLARGWTLTPRRRSRPRGAAARRTRCGHRLAVRAQVSAPPRCPPHSPDTLRCSAPAGKLPQAVGGWDDDRTLYKRLKRVQQFGGLAILMLTAMVTMLTVAYYTKEGVIAPVEDGVLAGGAFHNGTSLIDLDLDPQNSHGVCMPKADQAYLIFIDGLLIAQGSDNCDMEFVDKQLHAPACHNGDENMAGTEMWVAIEAQDSEALGRQMSKGAIMASMEWCGLEIQTNEHWRCSTTAEPHWMNPQKPLAGVANDPRSITHMEDAQGNDIWGEPAHVYTSAEVVPPSVKGLPKLQSGPEYRGGERPAKWIWAGGKSVAGMSNAVSADSVYCRRKISCKDEEFADQVEYTGYKCETAMVNQTQEQTEEIACEKEEAEGESAEEEAKCIPGLFRDAHNFFYGVGGAMLMIYMFVGFHIVCDDFFVPALNVLCEKLGIPDDIAGATFMAAGASSPELFASLIGVLSHSAVGAGTVVGSELFNMLVIIGGVCLVTPTVLTLDWRPLMREVFFFALSLAGILSTLHDSRVTLLEASILIGGYVAYVATCANYGKLTKIFCPISTAEDTAMSNAGADGQDGAPEEWELEEGMTEHDIRASINFTQDQLNGAAFGMSYGEVIMHSFMFKKSDFYTKVPELEADVAEALARAGRGQGPVLHQEERQGPRAHRRAHHLGAVLRQQDLLDGVRNGAAQRQQRQL